MERKIQHGSSSIEIWHLFVKKKKKKERSSADRRLLLKNDCLSMIRKNIPMIQ